MLCDVTHDWCLTLCATLMAFLFYDNCGEIPNCTPLSSPLENWTWACLSVLLLILGLSRVGRGKFPSNQNKQLIITYSLILLTGCVWIFLSLLLLAHPKMSSPSLKWGQPCRGTSKVEHNLFHEALSLDFKLITFQKLPVGNNFKMNEMYKHFFWWLLTG